MRFQIEGVKAGTNQAMKFVVETPDAATAIAEGVKCGMEQVRATPVDAVPAAAPVAAAASVSPVTPAGGKGGKGLMIGVGAGMAVLILIVTLVLVLRGGGAGAGGAGVGGAAGTTLDPRLYLPESAVKNGFLVFSMNAKAVMKIGVVTTLLENPEVRKNLQTFAAFLSPKNWDEVLVVMTMDTSADHEPAIFSLIKTTSDGTVSGMSQGNDPLEKTGTVAGFDVFASKNFAIEGDVVVKMGPALYLITSNVRSADLAAYLAKAGKGTPVELPDGVREMQAKVGGAGGDAVIYGMEKLPGGEGGATPVEVPMYFAGRVGADIRVSLKANDEIAADAETLIHQGLERMGANAPKVEIVRAGGSLTASMTADALAAGGPVDQWMKGAMGKASESAARISSAANLRVIMNACILWANDHDDMFPEHPAQLLVADMVVAKLFVNKRTTTVAAEFSAEELAAGKADWHPLATKLDGHNDYWYFGAGLKADFDSGVIVACENPAGLTDGINVAYEDGHVEFVQRADVSKAFDANNAARREKKMKEIAMSGGVPVAK